MKQIQVFAAGSTDGVFGTANLLIGLGLHPEDIGKKVNILFTQAFEVGELYTRGPKSGQTTPAWLVAKKLKKGTWLYGVDLAVNTADHKMTRLFLDRIHESGGKIKGWFDEHGSESWESVLKRAEKQSGVFHVFDRSNATPSATAIINMFHRVSPVLVDAANYADNIGKNMSVSEEAQALADMFNAAIKHKIADNDFRITAVKALMGDIAALAEVAWRQKQYAAMQAATEVAVADAEKKGKVLFIKPVAGVEIDMTLAMKLGYDVSGISVVAVHAEKAGQTEVVSFGRGPRAGQINLNAVLNQAGFRAKGPAFKATVPLEQGEGKREIFTMIREINKTLK